MDCPCLPQPHFDFELLQFPAAMFVGIRDSCPENQLPSGSSLVSSEVSSQVTGCGIKESGKQSGC